MLRNKDIPLFRHSHMRIYFSNINRTMPQHFLDIPDIDICFQKARGKGVPEHMWGDVLVYGGKGSIFINHPADRLVGKAGAVLVRKKMSAVFNFCFIIIFVLFQNTGYIIVSDLYFSFFGTFSINQNTFVGQIHIGGFQGTEFGNTHSGGKKQFDDRGIP